MRRTTCMDIQKGIDLKEINNKQTCSKFKMCTCVCVCVYVYNSTKFIKFTRFKNFTISNFVFANLFIILSVFLSLTKFFLIRITQTFLRVYYYWKFCISFGNFRVLYILLMTVMLKFRIESNDLFE